MSVHNVVWSATASSLANLDNIEAAMAWLTAGEGETKRERMRAYHGGRIHLLRRSIQRKKPARDSLANLGEDALTELLEGDLPARLADDNTVHLRISLDALARGEIQITDRESAEEVVKGRIKLEVYPGQDALQIATELLSKARERATSLGLPIAPKN